MAGEEIILPLEIKVKSNAIGLTFFHIRIDSLPQLQINSTLSPVCKHRRSYLVVY